MAIETLVAAATASYAFSNVIEPILTEVSRVTGLSHFSLVRLLLCGYSYVLNKSYEAYKLWSNQALIYYLLPVAAKSFDRVKHKHALKFANNVVGLGGGLSKAWRAMRHAIKMN